MSNAKLSVVERMNRVTAEMGRVRGLLTTPDAGSLSEATGSLSEVVLELEDMIADLSRVPLGSDAARLAAAGQMRAEQERVADLLREGSGFLSGCLRLLASHVVGYSIDGRPAPLPEVGQISVEA